MSHPENFHAGDTVRIQLRAFDRDADWLLVGRFLDCSYPRRGQGQMSLRFSIEIVNGVRLPYRQVHQWPIGDIRSVTKMEVVT